MTNFFLNTTRRCESVASEGKTRQKQARKRSLLVVNEHSEPVFNAVFPSAVAFTVSGKEIHHGF
ncbi:hypothetical protein F7R05_06585 [Pseudomonas koreensis]|nr:hypothetical protein F7R05_06585 [Pseudomonas koreensis]